MLILDVTQEGESLYGGPVGTQDIDAAVCRAYELILMWGREGEYRVRVYSQPDGTACPACGQRLPKRLREERRVLEHNEEVTL